MGKELEEFYALINAIVEDSVKQLGLPYIEASVIQKAYEKLMGTERIQTIKQALQRLEQIDNSNPSEALECLKIIENNIIYTLGDCDINDEVCQNLQYAKTKMLPIKQALLKAQEQEKVLEIIKKKKVNVGFLALILNSDDTDENKLRDYNCGCYDCQKLTREEFEILKEVFK